MPEMRVKESLSVISCLLILASSALAYGKVEYQYQETKELVTTVQSAASLLQAKGLSAINELGQHGSRYNHGDTYVFVLDNSGKMLYHPDPELDQKDLLELKDINGRPIVRSFIKRAMSKRNNNEGWVHYLWPKPGKLFPVWKNTYVKLAVDQRGNKFIVGSGLYEMKMEKRFVVEAVDDAVALLENAGEKAYRELRNRERNFFFGNIYVFVDDIKGTEIINPAFPGIEGTNILGLKDAEGREIVREYIELAKDRGSGWIEYLWPEPGRSTPLKKTTYVRKASTGQGILIVGCGYYPDSPGREETAQRTGGNELIAFVRSAASLVNRKGEAAFDEFRKAGSSWFSGERYVFVWDMSSKRIVYPPDIKEEGVVVSGLKDVHGKPIGKLFYEAVNNPRGEGWAYYVWPRPGEAYDSWKGTYLIKTASAKGTYLIGSGVYGIELDKEMIKERVEKAASLLGKEGRPALEKIKGKAGEFVFMDNYVFVDTPDGVELVNPGFPNLEGKNIIDYKDEDGRNIVKEYIELALKEGSGWIEYKWPKPGEDKPSLKQTYVKKVSVNGETFIVGAGAYL